MKEHGDSGAAATTTSSPTRHAIPAIFTRETLLATRSFLIEEPFVPALGDAVRPDPRAPPPLPELGGYVATEAKPRATVALLVPGEDEGPGARALALRARPRRSRSPRTPRPAGRGLARRPPSYTQLWTQVARWVATSGERPERCRCKSEYPRRRARRHRRRDGRRPAGSATSSAARPGWWRRISRSTRCRCGRSGRDGTRPRIPVDQDGSWLAGVQLTDGEERGRAGGDRGGAALLARVPRGRAPGPRSSPSSAGSAAAGC